MQVSELAQTVIAWLGSKMQGLHLDPDSTSQILQNSNVELFMLSIFLQILPAMSGSQKTLKILSNYFYKSPMHSIYIVTT